MECGAMHFGEFNPLDVLATAASSLQSSGARGDGDADGQTDGDDDADDGGGDDGTSDREPIVLETSCSQTRTAPSQVASSSHNSDPTSTNNSIFVCPNSVVATGPPKTNGVAGAPQVGRHTDKLSMPRVVKVVHSSGGSKPVGGANRPVVTLRDATKVMVSSKDGTYSVMRINKGQNPDHSYAVYSMLDKPKFDEDEGYCSRSSLGSPGQCWRSDSETAEPDVFEAKDHLDPNDKSPSLLPEGQASRQQECCLSPTGTTPTKSHKLSIPCVRGPVGGAKIVLSPPTAPSKSAISVMDRTPISSVPSALEAVANSKMNSSSKKPAKIVIVSRDANLRKFFSHSKEEGEMTVMDSMVPVDGCSTVEREALTDKTNKDLDTSLLESNYVDDTVELSPTTGLLSFVNTAPPHDGQDGPSTDIVNTAPPHDGQDVPSTDKEACGRHSDQSTDTDLGSCHNCQISGNSETQTNSLELCSDPEQVDVRSGQLLESVTQSEHPSREIYSKETSLQDVLDPLEQPRTPHDNGNKDSLHVQQTKSDAQSPLNKTDSVDLNCDISKSMEKNGEILQDNTKSTRNETSVISVDGLNVDCEVRRGDTSVLDGSGDSHSVAPGSQSSEPDHMPAVPSQLETNSNKSLVSDVQTPVISLGSVGPSDHITSSLSPDSHNGSCEVTDKNTDVLDVGEQSVIEDTLASKDTGTVATSGAQKVASVQCSSHKVLQGLLAAGKETKKSMTQTVLLPGGQICKLSTSVGSGPNGLDVVSGSKGTSALLDNKAGVVYLVSSSQPSVSLAAAAGIGQIIDKGQPVKKRSTASNQYIIQDDVPPGAKFFSSQIAEPKPVLPLPGKNVTSNVGSSTLCAVQTKGLVSTNKDNWILLKTSTATPKGQTSNIMTMAPPTIRGIGQGGCTMVPLLVGVNNSSRPKSLLPLVAKPPKSSSYTSRGTLERPLASKPMPNTIAIQPKRETTSIVRSTSSPTMTTTVAIPITTSLQSSQKLSTDSPLTESVPVASVNSATCNDLQEDLTSVKDMSPVVQTPSSDEPADTPAVTVPEKEVSQSQEDESVTLLLSDAGEDSQADESTRSGCVTPITPASGSTTPAYEGRMTPLGFMSSSSESSPSPVGGKINIKISGGVVVDIRQENGPRDSGCKATRSIGQVGSLSWQGMASTSAPAAVVKAVDNVPRRTWLKPSTPVKGEVVGQPEVRRKHKVKVKTGNPSRAELFRMRESAQNMSELHPLIDHDYCTFTEFSADIQSSIIATTESKLKTERKYIKKTKAARTKSQEEAALKAGAETPKLKKRKYTKRKMTQILRLPKEAVSIAVADHTDTAEYVQVPAISHMPPTVAIEGKKLRERKSKRRYRPRTSTDKNYVKIPGSYQDEFVYYATKKTRGRPRKFEGEAIAGFGLGFPQSAIPNASNISEFEWYREMSQIDKGTKFGVASVGSSSILKPPTSLSLPKDTSSFSTKGTTPIHESEVVDMVIDMMPQADMEIVTATVDSSQILGDLMHDNDDQHSVCSLPSTPSTNVRLGPICQSEESNSSGLRVGLDSDPMESAPTEEGTVDAGLMEEFHRLLNSMEESDQLKILANLNAENQEQNSDRNENKTAVENGLKEDGEGPLNNLNAYLSSYNQQSSVAEPQLSQVQNSQFLDLDEINDSDLLNTGELGNMSAIFGDLGTSSSASVSASGVGIMATSVLDSPTKTPSPHYSNYSVDAYPVLDRPLDKRELFPDISTPVAPAVIEFGGAPDLTLVNMYWNDLPGLMIGGQEYVRLVDIHKQVLPAKDTGILKKRCQMMGLDIQNCSELQRDFLIRYMNAAKSKSCVIVQKEAAKTLIGFYVDPRPRTTSKQTSVDSVPPSPAYQDEDASSVDTEPLSQHDGDVNICDEGCMEVQRPTSASVKNGRLWTMHDHDKQKKFPKKFIVRGHSSEEALRGPSKSRLPSTSRPVVHRSRSSPGASQLSSLDLKRSARLKNKKVQYASLHSEGWAEEEDDEEQADHLPRKADQVDKPAPTPVQVNPQTITITDENMVQKTVANVSELAAVDVKAVKVISIAPSRARKSTDESELRKLITKQQKRKLSAKEKRRILKLREKMQRLDSRPNMEEIRRLKVRREKWLKNLEKAKIKRLEDRAKVAKYSQEHCYAAYKRINKQDCKLVATAMDQAEEAVVQAADDSPQCNGSQPELNSSLEEESPPSTAQSETEDLSRASDVTVRDKPLEPVKVTRVEEERSRTLTEVANKTLPVIHRDSVQRGQRGRTQDGTLHLARYVTKEASCVQCNTCQEYLSIKRFLRHRHHHNSPDELVEVSLPQKLELDANSYPNSSPDPEDVTEWADFTQKRQMFAVAPVVPRRSRKCPRPDGSPPAKKSVASATSRVQNKAKKENKNTGAQGEGVVKRQAVNKRGSLASAKSVWSSPESLTSDVDTTPEANVRHSSRARKKKQLYPMESYVFSRRLMQDEPPSKRARLRRCPRDKELG